MNIFSAAQHRTVDLASHLGIMAAECELEAAMYHPLDWYSDFLRSLSHCYRESQYQLLEGAYRGRLTLK